MVVDGNNIAVRAIRAMDRKPLSVDGVPTGALLAFINSLAGYVRQERPKRLVVCWDGGRSHHRVAIFHGYKASRGDHESRHDVESPFGLAKTFLSLAGIHHVEIEGVEADDLVAHYWRIKGDMDRMVILSGDKDFLQLLDAYTEMVSPSDTERWTRHRVRNTMKCRPEDIPKVMSLVGDNGDNVPGVPLIGPKTAVKLLARHDWNLARLLDAGEPKLFGQREVVMRNLALVDLRTKRFDIDLPQPPPFVPTTVAGALWDELVAFLQRYQLNTIRTRLTAGALWENS